MAKLLSNLVIATLPLGAYWLTQAPGGAPAPGAARQDRWELLDRDADGRLGRYEAAAAAMELVGLAEAQGHQDGSSPEGRGVGLDEFRALVAGLPANAGAGAADEEGGGCSLTVEGASATLSGAIDGSMPGRLLEALLRHSKLEEIVLKDVTAASDRRASAEVARMIRESGLLVRVPRGASCSADGTDLLMSGTRRIVEPGARVGAPQDAAGEETPWLTEMQIHDMGLRTDTESLKLTPTGSTASLRGLCAISADVAWATGSAATVLLTTDGGTSWRNVAPDSIRGLDVRDVHALDASTAWIMTAGPAEASRILFTEDGGATWVEQHRETEKIAFVDGLDAFGFDHLIAYGDPMGDGRFRVLVTADGGKTWTPSATGPLALESGEASFAASGTGLRVFEGERAWLVTGGTGTIGRAFWSEDAGVTWTAVDTPVAAKGAGAGIFSVAFNGEGTGVVVGGDYLARDVGGTANAAWSADFGKTWTACTKGPRGQRAGSVAHPSGWFFATGQTGTDVSRDGGRTWQAFSSEGFHCVDAAVEDGTLWFAGPKGRVARVR